MILDVCTAASMTRNRAAFNSRPKLADTDTQLRQVVKTMKGDNEVVFTRFAVITLHPERRRIISETK